MLGSGPIENNILSDAHWFGKFRALSQPIPVEKFILNLRKLDGFVV